MAFFCFVFSFFIFFSFLIFSIFLKSELDDWRIISSKSEAFPRLGKEKEVCVLIGVKRCGQI